MSINILGGKAKGFSLVLPDPKSARPTSALLKRRFFDSNQDFSEHYFYDICAGSGSIGLEALSRGAKKAVFVELSTGGLKTLKKNIGAVKKNFDIEGEAEVLKSDCLKWIKSFEPPEAKMVIFFDPPYENQALYKKFLIEAKSRLEKSKGERATLVVEFCRQKTASEKELQEWAGKPDKSYRQGTSFLYVYDFS